MAGVFLLFGELSLALGSSLAVGVLFVAFVSGIGFISPLFLRITSQSDCTRYDLSDNCSRHFPGCHVFLFLSLTLASSPIFNSGRGFAFLSK